MENKQRELREQYTFNNRVMYLEDVKDILLSDTRNKGIEPSYNYFMSHPSLLNKHERFTHYLHYLIMFSTSNGVHCLLKEHDALFGEYATRMLINYPYVCSITHNVITPLICAAQWSNDPHMVRILAYWGADFSQVDIHGKYPEEKYASYYVNHLNHIIAPNYFTIGLRTGHDFVDIVKEIRILTGKYERPSNWKHPGYAYKPRSPISNSVLSSSPPLSNSAQWASENTGSRRHLTNSIPEETSTYQSNQHT